MLTMVQHHPSVPQWRGPPRPSEQGPPQRRPSTIQPLENGRQPDSEPHEEDHETRHGPGLRVQRNSSKQIWDYVRTMYTRDRSKLYDLWADITKLKQNKESLTKYLEAFCALKYELEEALPVGDDAEGSEMKKQREMLLSFSFLMGLRTEFEPVIHGILREKEMPSLDEVYGRVAMHNERRRGVCGSQQHTTQHCPAEDVGALIDQELVEFP